MQSAKIISAALGKSAGQLGMADEIGMVVAKRGGAKDMVGMDVGHDHIADRQLGARADRRAKLGPFAIAPAWVDHRDGIVSDDKTDIGDLVVICRRGVFLHPVMDKDSGRDFSYGQRRGPAARKPRCSDCDHQDRRADRVRQALRQVHLRANIN